MKQSQAAQTMEVDQTASAYRVWEFAGSAQGFSAGAQDVLETGDAQLRYTAGKEGALSSPGGLSIPAGAVRTVEFRLKTETRRNPDPGMGGCRRGERRQPGVHPPGIRRRIPRLSD